MKPKKKNPNMARSGYTPNKKENPKSKRIDVRITPQLQKCLADEHEKGRHNAQAVIRLNEFYGLDN